MFQKIIPSLGINIEKESKRLRHFVINFSPRKLFSAFLILLITFTLFSFLFKNGNRVNISNALASSLSVSFIDPTPQNGATVIYPNYAYLNTSIADSNPSTALTGFIDCNNSLVGWWRFNNETGESGTLIKDWSTYGNNGTCSGASCPASKQGKFGSALQFDGTDDYINAGSRASLNITNKVTVEAWIKPATVAAGVRTIFYNGTAAPIGGYAINQEGDKLNGYIYTNSWQATGASTTTLVAENWYHVVMTYDGANIKLFVNAVDEQNPAVTGSINSPAGAFNQTSGIAGYGQYFNGTIDEVRIWNRALTPDEIKASYDAGQNRLYRKIISSTNNSYTCSAQIQDSQGEVSTSGDRTFNIVNDNSPYFLIATGSAITNSKILPDTDLDTLYNNNNYDTSTNISLQASKGEYTAASFVVSSSQDLTNLNITASDLTNGGNTIPADNIDIKAVKVWYQSGTSSVSKYSQDLNILTPELLLHDDSLVKTEGTENFIKGYNCSGCYIDISQPRFPLKATDSAQWQTEENYLTANVKPTDMDTLQPVNISANTLKQFWVTIHIPQDQASGNYTGAITLDSNGAFPIKTIALQTEVLPFTLEDPVLDYSIYYLSAMSDSASIIDVRRSPEQIANEMKNLKAHGIDYPIVYEPYSTLSDYLTIMADKGFKKDKIYLRGIDTYSFNPDSPDTFKASVTNFVNLSKSFGYGDVYIYGMDEVQGSELIAERPAFQAVHEAGAKNFVASYTGDLFTNAGDLMDTANIAFAPNSSVASQYHSLGHKIFNYANPQLGAEQPETYRRNYGLLLYNSGYDGAMVYAYQHSFDFGWNDFDNPDYKDHLMAYPTMNGVVDTIEWEGFREGVNDVRYLSTLLKYINLAKAQTGNVYDLGVQAEDWINSADFTNGDLDQIRTDMISQTKNIYVALDALVTPAPTETPAPTPAPTSGSSSTSTSSSNSSSSTSAPSCGNTVTNGTPDLFEIRTNKNTATVYFAPPTSPYSSFYIAYSRKPDSVEYGVEYYQGYSGGVLSYTITMLQPNTKYYFKIRAGNGCATGNWGNTMSASTTSYTTQTKTNYKNIFTSIIEQVRTTINNLLANKKINTNNEQSQIININTPPTLQPVNILAPKKITPIQQPTKLQNNFCILWWCF